MQIFCPLSRVNRAYPNPVVAIGVFDGVHRGHQKLLQAVVKRAKKIQGTAMVITFSPHPMRVLNPAKENPLIVPLVYRIELISKLNIDVCLVIHFTKRFASLSPEQFIRKYLVEKIRPKEIFVGDDFRFGQNREGDLEYFREAGVKYGFFVRVVATTRRGREKIGSRRIRTLILDGKLKMAARLLNRPVSLLGRVVKGQRRGKSLGFPTANINPEKTVFPPIGVYVVQSHFNGKTLQGIANLGKRPSFDGRNKVNLEVYFFNFRGNLYGKEIVVEFLQRIRDEQRFESKDKLISRIKLDEEYAHRWLDRKNVAGW